MKVDDLKKYLRKSTLQGVGDIIGKSKGTISLWNSKGIPDEQQAVLEIRTGGALKSNTPTDLIK